MNRDRESFAEAGAPLFVIGQGDPEDGARFHKDFKLDFDLLVDTERRAYEAAGTKVGGLGDLFAPKVVTRGVGAALRSGVVQGRTVGHPSQLGGLLLINPDNDILWSHLSTDASDLPSNDEVIEAIRAALGSAGKRPAA